MKTILAVWLLTHAWFVSITQYLDRHGANWWQDFSWAGFWREVQISWGWYIRFLETLVARWEAQAMDFALHLGISLLSTLLGCLIVKVFFNFGRGGLYPFAALLMGLVLVSCAAYVVIVLAAGA